ncbi:hypothetical protein ACOME3_008834 [Neoechinorhynchus agilis]
MIPYKSEVLKNIERNLSINLCTSINRPCLCTGEYIDPFIRSTPKSSIPYFLCRAFSYGIKSDYKRMYKTFCRNGCPEQLEPLAIRNTRRDENDSESDESCQADVPLITRRKVFILSCVLTLAFEKEYDLTGKCHSTDFVRFDSLTEARKSINECINMACDLFYSNDFSTRRLSCDLWSEIDNIVHLGRSEFYSYMSTNNKKAMGDPVIRDDPYRSEDLVDSKNVIIYCRNPKRVIVISFFAFK